MKKQFTLSLLLLCLFSGLIHAQSLIITEWAVYEFEGADPNYFAFGTDVLSASEDGVSFDAISNFSSTDTDLWLHDITSEYGCNPADTGRYSYEIVNDTLHFTLIEDSCAVRQMTFLDAFWVQVALSVEDENPLTSLSMYPNPAQNEFTILLQGNEEINIKLIDFSGRVIRSSFHRQKKIDVDISDLAIGIYFVEINQGGFVETRRLVKSN